MSSRRSVEAVQVGAISIPFSTAERWVREYTSESNKTAANPYSYPAYDLYEKEQSDPRRVSDADLLAPVLLNVSISVRSYYALQAVRGLLEEALANDHLDFPLAEIGDRAIIAAMVKPLYAVLDGNLLWGMGATKLSKILHRKRPESIVLHDKWVRKCYVGEGLAVPLAKKRSWSDYMVAITEAIGRDVREQPDAFMELGKAVGGPGKLSNIRLLDILAWRSRGNAPS